MMACLKACQLPGEEHIIGPMLFCLTDPENPWDPNRSQGANRHHAIELCHGQDLVFANTFKAPTPERTVSYRDKWQPPTKQYTPQGFNTLDHVLIDKKWLPTITQIKNRPDIAFPTDHFIIQTNFRIKLGAKTKTPKTTPPINYTCETSEEAERKAIEFNQKVQDRTQAVVHPTNQHTPPRELIPQSQCTRLAAYTDGSCFKNKQVTCNTPAGWGFFVEDSNLNPVYTSHGPVITNQHNSQWMGARVGSNNPGELQALGELALYILHKTTHTKHITLGYDSKIAANFARGIWKPKKNKEIARYVRCLYKKVTATHHITWKWIKGHSKNPGNEIADELAKKGCKNESHNNRASWPDNTAALNITTELDEEMNTNEQINIKTPNAPREARPPPPVSVSCLALKVNASRQPVPSSHMRVGRR